MEREHGFQAGGIPFGRYTLVSVMGMGGFASVYRARDPRLGRDVALKTLLPHLADDPALGRHFLDEARTLARFRHPNIVTVFDADTAAGRPYFTMELIEGQTLAQLLAGTGPVQLARACTLLWPLAEALDALHAVGIVHRDVKPANVMLARDGRVLLMDFGIAHLPEATTTGNQLLGTVAYMAPEQVLGETVDGRTDVYALGIVAYQLLTGSLPFRGEEAMAVALKHVHEPVPSPRSRNPALSPAVQQVLLKGLAKDPEARYACCSTFVRALAQAVEPSSLVAAATFFPISVRAFGGSNGGARREREAEHIEADTRRLGRASVLREQVAGAAEHTPAGHQSPVAGDTNSPAPAELPPSTAARPRKRRLHSVAIALLLLLLVASAGSPWAIRRATSSASTPGKAVVWSGTWNTTNFGTLQLTQGGDVVTGTYTLNNGRITGRVSGNQFIGTWSEAPSYQPPKEAGDVVFTMSPDGDSFTGRWRFGGADVWHENWNGSRTSAAQPAQATPGPGPQFKFWIGGG